MRSSASRRRRRSARESHRVTRQQTLTAARRRVEQFRASIRQHDYRYYVFDWPTICYAAYDRLLGELVRLEAAHPELVTPESPTSGCRGDRFRPFRRLSMWRRVTRPRDPSGSWPHASRPSDAWMSFSTTSSTSTVDRLSPTT